ncbi:CotH kinase family protein [Crocinitomix sp.]|nr:CotH kinase family protein [Crocinitomix sp.]
MKHFYLYILFFITHSLFAQDEVKVDFKPTGGKFDQPIDVVLSAPEGAKIYYTLDGSVPSSGANRYQKPIHIKDVNVIRAVAYLDGKRSNSVTQSYFCDRTYSLPIISIATNPENLWDYNTGIYVTGCCADTVEPYLGANFWKDWEKYANIEMYETDGSLCFNQGVGINLFGGFSRALPQKSLAVFARDKYGDNRIEYPIFPDRDYDKFKSFIIRNSGGDFQRTHFRDAFMTQLAAPTGVAVQAYRPAIVFLNGQYWGIQNLREKISEHYLKSNFGVDKGNVDILRHNGVKRHGYSTNYKKFLAYLRNNDLSDDTKMDALRKFMDVEDYIRYNIAEVYSDNRDAGGNIRYWRERNDSAKWRWVFYDLDMGLGNNEPNGYKRNTLQKFTNANTEAWPDPAWSTFIIRKLLSNEMVKIQYINTFADHLNTVYKEETALALIDKIKSALNEEMPYHVKRWHTSFENWEYHVDIVRRFVRERPKYLRQFIIEKFGLEGLLNVSIKHPGKKVAAIEFNSLKIKDDFEGIYFKNVPVKISVIPKHDYVFKGWKGRPETEQSIVVYPKENLILEPLFEPRPKSVYADSIIFNELCIYQVESDTSDDWIELYNRSNERVNIGGWTFTDDRFDNGFKLPDNLSLEPHQFIILCEDKLRYSTRFNIDTVQVVGDFKFGLSAKGELIKLYDNDGFIVDSITFAYSELDSSATLNLMNPDSSRYNSSHWNFEVASPGKGSKAYLDYLKSEADKKYWTKIYYIGGGSFFFILVAGFLSLRFYKRRRLKRDANQ